MPSGEHTQDWIQEKWIDVLSRSTDKPRMEYCEDQIRTILYSNALQDNQSKPVLFETDIVELEGIHIPHGQLFQPQINPGEWSMGRRIKSETHETSVFLLDQFMNQEWY